MESKIKTKVTGYYTTDGGGVNLIRVLGIDTINEFDPILMLDSFDSKNPKDYIAGFPFHPHRGIETITYVYSGKMTHRDSIGNEDTVSDGEVQWMTAGSGIFHEELLPEVPHMLGVQLWLNLSEKDKMVEPEYYAIKNIKEIPLEQGKIRLLAGKYKEYEGFKSKYQPVDYYDIHIEPKSSIEINRERENSVMLFALVGDVYIGNELIEEKTAVSLTEGDIVKISTNEKRAQVLFFSSKPLNESIAWNGPIVMNKEEELQKAYEELNSGTFLKKNLSYEFTDEKEK